MNDGKENIQTIRKKTRWFTVDKKMLPSKIGYFISFSAWGCFLPFRNIFLVSVGLTPKEAGFISGMAYVIHALSCPLWGFLADSTGQRRLIFVVLCLGSALTVLAQPWVAWKINTNYLHNCLHNESIRNGSMKSYVKNTSFKHKPFDIDIPKIVNDTYRNVSFQSTARKDCFSARQSFSSTLFYTMLALMITSQSLTGPLIAILDSVITNIAKSSNKESSFGTQRVFGSIGFGICSFAAGIAADNFFYPTFSKYTPVFYMASPFFLLMIPLGCILLKQTNWEVESNTNSSDDVSRVIAQISKFKQVLNTLNNLRNVFFFLSILVSGITFNVYLSFMFLLMNDEMHASKTAMGLASFVSCFSEIFMFPFSAKIITFFGSPLRCIELGILSFVIRFILLSYIENPWASIPVQVLHSFGFALLWAAIVEYVQSISSKAICATMFGIVNSIHFGFGAGIGNMIGGLLYNKYGGQALYRGTATFAGVWVIIMFFCLHVPECINPMHHVPNKNLGDIDHVDLTMNTINEVNNGSETVNLMGKAC